MVILLFVAYKLTHKRLIRAAEYQSRGWHGVLAGSVAGTTPAMAHVGDPLVAMHLMLHEIPPRAFVATGVLFFATLNGVKFPTYL